MELFKQLSFPRSENTAEITAESWMFVVDQVLNVEKPIEHKTTAYFLTSLTDFIAEQQPQGSVPKYLNIRRIIEAYKFENWIPEIIELPESGYEIDWYYHFPFRLLAQLMIAISVARPCILGK